MCLEVPSPLHEKLLKQFEVVPGAAGTHIK
jgi:hypothetical protein